MAQPFTNTYHKRLVNANSSKPCFICYKPTSTVLNQEESKDWFYVCPGHLTDRGFASPIIDVASEKVAAEKKRKEELEKEIEAVKKEYEEKMRKKKGKGKDKEKEKEKKTEEEKEKEEEKERDEKIKELEGKKAGTDSATGTVVKDDGPRVFELHKSIFQMRVQKYRSRFQSAQMQQRVQAQGGFPSVPTGLPGT